MKIARCNCERHASALGRAFLNAMDLHKCVFIPLVNVLRTSAQESRHKPLETTDNAYRMPVATNVREAMTRGLQ